MSARNSLAKKSLKPIRTLPATRAATQAMKPKDVVSPGRNEGTEMSKDFVGQRSRETQQKGADEPGGQTMPATRASIAARQKPKRSKSFDGQVLAEAHHAPAVDAPGQPPIDAQNEYAGGGQIAGQSKRETHSRVAGDGADRDYQIVAEAQRSAVAIRATIAQVIDNGRHNAFAIRQRMRVRQATLSHIARGWFRYHTGLKEAERKQAMDAASRLIKEIQNGLVEHPATQLVLATNLAAAPWEKIESDTEKVLGKLARKLPGYEFVKGVRGFGDVSFARIIAETGDLSGYANPAKVWKRLGLAVIDGKSQRKARDKEMAKLQGYSPYRRAVAYVAFEPVIKAQSAPKESGGQSNSEAQPRTAAGAVGVGQLAGEAHGTGAGPYRQLYDTKKSDYLARIEAGEEGWTKLRAHRAAMRYASKRLYRDLWVAWNRDITGQRGYEAQGDPAGDGDRGGQGYREAHQRSAAPAAARKRK